MRLAAYAGASVALATGVLLKALHQRSNFYSACVYLSQSSANLMILTNLCLLFTGFVLFWLQRLLYGPLRPIETEQLYERAWFAVTETCLAMTIFRGELGGWFLVMFISLLVGKVWGWIGEGRVEFLEQQPPANPRLFHIRLALSLVLTVLFDSFMLHYCVQTVITQARPDMMVMFGFEFAILTILSTSTLLRYVIALTEIYITRQQVKAKMEERACPRRSRLPPEDLPDENEVNEMEIDVPGWEEKGRWVFYLDLLTDLLKLVIYLSFFGILLTFYGLPIHILRDVVVTIRSFARRIMDFMRYRNATRDMNERYPDATAEEVSREDVCIICREEMIPVQPAQPAAPNAAEEPAPQRAARSQRVPDRLRPKKLPCGHILHFACLRSWLERQQNCPTCRRPVVSPPRTQGVVGVGANNAPGGQQGAIQPGQGGADLQPRARIYQFGPFRIGFGAVRGDLLHNLQQQAQRIQNLQQQAQHGNVPQPGANPPANPPGAQEAGFGVGFGNHPQAPTPTPGPHPAAPSTATDLSSQLLQIEQRLVHEINTLRVAKEQLMRVRHLRVELERLHNQANSLAQNTLGEIVPPQNEGSASSVSVTRLQFEATNPRAEMMTSGDPRLPEGLTLPPGWTLLPLQRSSTSSGGVAEIARPTPTTAASSSEPVVGGTTASQDLTVPASSPDQTSQTIGSSNGGSAMSTSSPVNGAANAPTSESMPTISSAEHRAESPSQEWTDVTDDKSATASIPTTWGSNGEAAQQTSSQGETQAESSSKGKARTATVEETADEEA
ncbi:RING finger protein [Penicillium sp. DV-2018c]|nr:RING finger protein [Penicillium sp. DV-2018c]